MAKLKKLLATTLIVFASNVAVAKADVYQGRINGEFHGWDGETIYQLQDGHIIKQSIYHYHYHYAFSPEVIIYATGANTYKIHVIGDSDDDVGIEILR